MKRRDFLKVTGIAAASTAVAAPAIAQSMPELKWRMPTSWPKSLDTLYGGAEIIDLGEAKSAVQSPSEMVIARRRFTSIRLSSSTPRMTGTIGTSSFLSTQPSTPKITITIRSKVDPEMP